MKLDYKGKNVFVTGGAGGIGSEIVKSMVSHGANVIISGSNKEKLKNFANQFSPSINFIDADLSKNESLDKIVKVSLNSLITNGLKGNIIFSKKKIN